MGIFIDNFGDTTSTAWFNLTVLSKNIYATLIKLRITIPCIVTFFSKIESVTTLEIYVQPRLDFRSGFVP